MLEALLVIGALVLGWWPKRQLGASSWPPSRHLRC